MAIKGTLYGEGAREVAYKNAKLRSRMREHTLFDVTELLVGVNG
jgi:hypothetical protein